MPVDPVVVDTTIVASGEVLPSYGNILLIGENEGGSLGENTVTRYTKLSDIATGCLNSSKIYKAAVNIFNQGVQWVYVVKITKSTVTAESINAGSSQSFANSPVKGGTVACATYNGEYAFNDPPVDPGASKFQVGSEGTKIFLNGAGSKSVDYHWYNMTTLEAAIKDYERTVDIIYFVHYTDGAGGNGGFSAQDWGPFAKIADRADTYAWIMVVNGRGDETAATQLTDLKCGTQASFTSKNVVTIAHKDAAAADDIGACVCGRIALTYPWDKLMWKPLMGLTSASITQFSKTEVANFEAVYENALILKQGVWRMSAGMTMAGGGSSYTYLDITRTRYYLEENIIWDLETMVANSSLPFTQAGILTVKNCIEKTLQAAVEMGALRPPFILNGAYKKGYAVTMPNIEDVSDADRLSRQLKNIYVAVYLQGQIESITLNLSINL